MPIFFDLRRKNTAKSSERQLISLTLSSVIITVVFIISWKLAIGIDGNPLFAEITTVLYLIRFSII
jgi:hypothetical protein